jgi:glycosyltransferase involved in cell wall biosynthesis
MPPTVTTLIDTYNQAHFLDQALNSVLEQGLSPSELEILVVDDGSTDNTASLVAKFAPRVRYIHKSNGGQASAFKVGIRESHAPIIAFLDADDWWAKGKLRAVLDVFEREPATTAVGHGFIRVHEQTGRSETCLPAEIYRLSLANPDAARFAYSGRPFLSTSKLSVRRRVVDRAGTFPDSLVFFDVPLQLFAMALGTAVVLDQPLCFYRLHGENLYESRTPNVRNLRRRIEFLNAWINFLPAALAGAGVPPDVVSAFLDFDRIESKRLRLILDNGWPWETFRLERRSFHSAYEHHSSMYGLFKFFVLAATLLVSPRTFYRLRDWYGVHNLRRFRKVFGEPVPIPSIQAQSAPLTEKHP